MTTAHLIAVLDLPAAARVNQRAELACAERNDFGGDFTGVPGTRPPVVKPHGDSFRLRGHTPFDIVFGYGRAGVTQDAEVKICLGPSAQKTLADAVGMLGWDLRRLEENRFRPLLNALNGLRADYGIQETGFAPGPPLDVRVHFHGPFSAMDEDRSGPGRPDPAWIRQTD